MKNREIRKLKSLGRKLLIEKAWNIIKSAEYEKYGFKLENFKSIRVFSSDDGIEVDFDNIVIKET